MIDAFPIVVAVISACYVAWAIVRINSEERS